MQFIIQEKIIIIKKKREKNEKCINLGQIIDSNRSKIQLITRFFQFRSGRI